MVICFLLDSHCSASLGGAELQVKYLMDECRRRGHELHYICRHASAHREDGVNIERIRRIPVLSRYVHFIDYTDVREKLLKIDPNLIYTRVDLPYVGFAASYCKRNGCKTIWHIAHERDVTPYKVRTRRQLIKWLDRKIFEYGVRRTDVILGQAEYQDILLRDTLKRRCDRIVPNFHPTPAEGEIAKPENEVVVTWIANIKPFKQPELYLRLVEQCRGLRKVRFQMVGALHDQGYRKMIAEIENENSNFVYLGPRSLDKANRIIARSHILVNTSINEGFPNTFIQAWLRETVVLSLAVDPDGVLSRKGMGVVAGSLSGLVEQLEKLSMDKVYREGFMKGAKRYADEHHSMHNAAALVSLMEELNENRLTTAVGRRLSA